MQYQLPLEVQPHADESAVGFCLRSASMNSMNLHWLRRACGISATRLPSAMHARRLAWTLQCPEQWLAAGLGSEVRSGGVVNWHWHGHELFLACHLRRQWPQICPLCIHDLGYCSRLWDLSLLTACPLHRVRLVDVCSHCRSHLRWDRPKVDICHCGRPFECRRDQQPACSRQVEFALLLQTAIDRDSLVPTVRACNLPEFMSGLSLGGLLVVIDGFGSMEHEFHVQPSSRQVKLMGVQYWEALLGRSAVRLQEFKVHPNSGTALVVDQTVLCRMRERTTHDVDERTASALIAALRGSSPLGRGARAEQRSLF